MANHFKEWQFKNTLVISNLKFEISNFKLTRILNS